MWFIRLQIISADCKLGLELFKTRAFRFILYTCTLQNDHWWQLYCDLWQRNELSCISIKCVLSWKNKHKRSLKVFSSFCKLVILSSIQLTLISCSFNGVWSCIMWLRCNISAIFNLCILGWNVCNSHINSVNYL